MSKKNFDITGKIGSPFKDKDPEWPMYSYDRPAYYLWNSIAKTLDERGWSEGEIKTWLQSKGPRWALDGELGDAINKLGAQYAQGVEKIR